MRILNRLGGIELSQAYATHQGDLEEEDRGHRPGPRSSSSRGPSSAGWTKEQADEDLRPDRVLRRLRLQQVAHAPPTPWSPTRRPTSRPTTRPSSWPPCSPRRWTGPSARSSSSSTSTTAGGWGSRSCRPNVNEGELDVPGRRARGRSTSAWGRSRGSASRRSRRSSRPASRAGRSRASTTSSSGCRPEVVSQACVETLIKAGAFDCLGGQRSQWLAVLPRAIQAGQAEQEDRRRGQRGLFDVFDDAAADGNGHANGNGKPRRRRACPTSPSCPTPSGWPRRRRSSASTCRATR